jgi:hypothetical protein
MMDSKNRDHLAIQPDLEAYWKLAMASDATTCSEETEEMLVTCSELFDAFFGFIQPTGAKFKVTEDPSGHSLPTLKTGEGDRLETTEVQLEMEDGIEYDDIKGAVQFPDERALWLPRIFFDSNKVKVNLAEGTQYLDRNSPCVTYRRTARVDDQPQFDPLSMDIWHLENIPDNQIDSDFIYMLSIRPHSDIWFEDGDIGLRNRELLSSFFERLEKTFHIEAVDRHSNWFPSSRLEEIY